MSLNAFIFSSARHRHGWLIHANEARESPRENASPQHNSSAHRFFSGVLYMCCTLELPRHNLSTIATDFPRNLCHYQFRNNCRVWPSTHSSPGDDNILEYYALLLYHQFVFLDRQFRLKAAFIGRSFGTMQHTRTPRSQIMPRFFFFSPSI